MTTRQRRDCACLRSRHKHGTRQAFVRDRCRCDDCTAASSEYHRARRATLGLWVPRTGTTRRLQALAADGWTDTEIARRAYCEPSTISGLRRRQGIGVDIIHRHDAARIAAIYDELWWQTPPPGQGSTYVTGQAERRGWAQSWQWEGLNIDDPAVQPRAVDDDPDDRVEQLMAGTLRLQSNSQSPEITEAIRRLAAQHRSDAEIGALLGTSRDAIHKRRVRAGIPAGVTRARVPA